MPSILRDQGLRALLEDPEAPLETIAAGLVFTEGPLELADGSILFQDIKAEKTYRIAADGGMQTLRSDTRAANGQTLDSQGLVVFCEQNGRRVSRMKPDGTQVETLLENYEDKRLNSPNDVVCLSDGSIVFTDPAYGVTPEKKELPYQGVFWLNPSGKTKLLVEDFEKPNGLAFSPDEKILYICDTGRYHVRAFDYVNGTDGPSLSNGRVFATLDPGQPGGPDGMKVDSDGRVYVAVALGVWVFSPEGVLLGILETPKRPSNLAWSGAGAKTLLITAVDSVHRARFKTPGLLPAVRRA